MITSLIVAAADNDVIGRDGDLPWRLPEDLRRFRQLTTGHVVVAGRRTHQSILRRLRRPLPDRTTVVVTSGPAEHLDGVLHAPTAAAALDLARELEAAAGGDEVFVIGGAITYRETLGEVGRIYLTRVHVEVDGDARMPAGWLDGFAVAEAGGRRHGPDGTAYTFTRHERT